MGIRAQAQEVEQVMQVRLPIPLRVGIQRQVHPRQFPRQPLAGGVAGFPGLVLVQHFGVMVVGLHRVLAQQVQHMRRFLALQHRAAPLPVGRGLRRQLRRLGDVELPVQDRIAGGIFVHVGGAMADPLPRDEDRQLHMVFDLAHLKRGGVPVPHQIADQPGIFGSPPSAAAIGHAGGLHDGVVVAHIVDDADEAVIQHRHRLVQHGFQCRHGRAQRFGAAGALGGDFGELGVCQAHAVFPGLPGGHDESRSFVLDGRNKHA